MTKVQQLFAEMPAAFQEDEARGLTVVFQFDITGDGGGKWTVSVDNGKLSIVEGEHPKPDTTFASKADDYVAIAEGRLNEMLAFASGRIKIHGDLGKAMKLKSLFKR